VKWHLSEFYSPSSWTSGIIDHPNQRDGHNCGVIVLKVILEKSFVHFD